MVVRNKDLREAKGKIPAWAIAEKLGVHENSIYRLFRSNISSEKKQELLNAIETVKKEWGNE